jgi:hypothetical protein
LKKNKRWRNMKFKKIRWVCLFLALGIVLAVPFSFSTPKNVQAQQPTGSIPTVTGTPHGPTATIRVGLTGDRVNVRSGPSTLYDPPIGILLVGASVPVKGKSPAGDWLLIEYPGVPGGTGWVWALYMDVTPGEIPVVELPPAPIARTTITTYLYSTTTSSDSNLCYHYKSIFCWDTNRFDYHWVIRIRSCNRIIFLFSNKIA